MDPRDEAISDEEKFEKQDQDFAPPFSTADDIKEGRRLSKEDPHLDDGVDSDEAYQEGPAAAAGLPDDDDPDEDEHAQRIA
jgi:hypothetical protein